MNKFFLCYFLFLLREQADDEAFLNALRVLFSKVFFELFGARFEFVQLFHPLFVLVE